VADAVVGVPLGAGGGLRAGVVGGGWGGAVGERAVRTSVVVLAAELVEEHLEIGERARLDGLGAEPLLHRLLEALCLAAGGRVGLSGVLLSVVAAAGFGFEGVLASFSAAASEPDGVDHAVVGERGCGVS